MDVSAALPAAITSPIGRVLREPPSTELRMRTVHSPATAAAHQGGYALCVQESHNFGRKPLQHAPFGVNLSSPLRTLSSCGNRGLGQKKKNGRSRNLEGDCSVRDSAVRAGKWPFGIGDAGGPDESSGWASISDLPDDPKALKAALLAAETRAREAEKARRDALEALSIAETKAQEYATAMARTSEDAIAQLGASKDRFKTELKKALAAKSRQVGQAKQDAVNLAINVEKLADTAIRVATRSISQEARLKTARTETAAADAALRVQQSIRSATANAADLVMKEASSALTEALAVAAVAQEQAARAQEAREKQSKIIEELADARSSELIVKGKLEVLEQRLHVSESLVESLRAELAAGQVRIDEALERVTHAEDTVREVQAAAEKAAQEREESMKQALETIKASVVTRENSSNGALSADIEALKAAYFTAQEVASVKEQANIRVHEALGRSLTAAENVARAWKNRALTVESILLSMKEDESKVQPVGRAEEIIHGGRMENLLGSNSRKWDLLANGPRRQTPEWMKWRIQAGLQNLPPRNPLPIASQVEAELPLHLPTPDEVWSISFAKAKKDDLFTQVAVEKEALDEQRRALERALEKKSDQRDTEKKDSATGSGYEIVFQGFNWESWRRKWYVELSSRGADLSKCGITTIWMPPPTTSVSPQGYMPGDLYDLNSAYGTVEELKECIEELHRNNIQVLGDAVLNHRCAQKQSANGIWNIFGGKLAWGPEAIVKDDPNFQGRGNPSNGDFFHAAPNIDHSQDFVRKDIMGWMKWLRTEIGFDGWRLDFVRGFWGGYVKEYIEATNPVFSIGEYWDSLAYEGGQVCYNQDAHRQRIINWINATGGTSSAFDVTTKGILHSALHNEYWRLIDPQGKPPGVMGWWPSRAVTFLENHDTGSTQGHWPFPRDKIMQGYAYILTHPGTPVVFYDHFYDFGLHDQIAELIAARQRTGVGCRSPIKIFHANFDGYVAQVGDDLLVKLGKLDWNPSKENNLVGKWERLLDKGEDYQLWERS
ncbi:unnamed protein product [Calypogeia fissa]